MSGIGVRALLVATALFALASLGLLWRATTRPPPSPAPAPTQPLLDVAPLVAALNESLGELALVREELAAARAAIGESDAVRALAERVDALAEASDAAARAQAHRQEALWHHIERLERDADDDDGLGEQTNLTRLLQRRSVDGRVIFGVANHAFRDFALNWACALTQLGVQNYFVVAQDVDTFRYLRRKGVPSYYPRALAERNHYGQPAHATSGAELFGNAGFAAVVAVKSLVLADVLDAGFGALVCDVDIVPIQEPFKALADAGALSPDVDLAIQTDSCHPSAHFEDLNSGFFWTAPTERGKTFARRTIELMLAGKKIYVRQQIALNRAAREMAGDFLKPLDSFCKIHCNATHDACLQPNWPLVGGSDLRVLILPPGQWMTGRAFYHWRLHQQPNAPMPAIVHANWLRGHSAKQTMLNRAQLWLVDEHLSVQCDSQTCEGCMELNPKW